jgi:hypothetical protein
LPAQNFLPRLHLVKPARPIDLGKLLNFPGFRRPFERKEIARDRGRIVIAFDRPGVNDFSAWLPEFAEETKFAFRREACLLQELPLRGGKQILARRGKTLRDRPRAFIFLRPERAARMHEEKFRRLPGAPVEQDACTDLFHGSPFPELNARVNKSLPRLRLPAYNKGARA